MSVAMKIPLLFSGKFIATLFFVHQWLCGGNRYHSILKVNCTIIFDEPICRKVP